MIRSKWLSLCESAASAAVMFLFSSAWLVSGSSAQSVQPALAGPALTLAAPSTFLEAPSFPLGYAPSSVAAGDLTRGGKVDLVTADSNSGKITVFLGLGQGNFAAGVAYDAGPHPGAILVADISGNGRLSVLVVNESEGTISVLRGNGDGTLQARQSYSVGFNPSFIVAGDFTGSGRVDVAVAAAQGNLLAILLNDGTGKFEKPIVVPLAKTPTALAAGDFNNDGRTDLALANADGTVTVLLGHGVGQFSPLADTRVASGTLSSIASGDFNHDGKIDLAVTQPGQKLVSVLLGKGNGTFAPPASYAVGNEPVSAMVADVDGDGVADLVVVNKNSNTFSVLDGNGDGTFKTSVDFVAGNAPLAAVAADFYGNGHLGLAIVNHSSQTVSLPPGNGDGTFKAGRSYAAGVQPDSIASGNLNGDKAPGLVVANYCGSDPACGKAGSVSVFLADATGAYRLSSTYAVGAGPVSVALADVKGDKNLDIVALNRIDKTVSVLLGAGDGSFKQPMTFPLAGSPVALAVGDVNRDGKPDLAVVEDCGTQKCAQAGTMEILLGAGDGSFQSAASYTVGYAPVSVAMGDINGDKKLDILVANGCGKDASCKSPGTASVLLGDGTGKFTAGADVALGQSPASITLVSLGGGAVDLVVSRSTGNTVAVLRGNRDGTFLAGVPYAVGSQPGSLVVADLNGDGNADVAVANFKDSTVSVLLGRGDGTLQPASTLSVGAGPQALTAIASTTTGLAGLATANGNSASATLGTEITVLARARAMDGTGSGPSPVTLTSGTNPSSVNQEVLLTAVVTGNSGAPTGTITFNNNGAAISDCGNPVALNGAGTATCTTYTLQAIPDSLTADYSGDSVYAASSSNTVSQTVHALAATLGLTAAPSTSTSVNTMVTFTSALSGVVLTPVVPSGTVTFAINGAASSDCPAVKVTAAGIATCTTSSLVAPADVITATYAGDSNFTVAVAATITETVGKVAADTTLTSAPASPSVNQQVTLKATVAAPGGGTPKVYPTGTVTFTEGAATLCAAVALAGNPGTATCSYVFNAAIPSPGSTITATYSGDANFSAGSPATYAEIVTASSTTTTLTSAPNPSSVNASVDFAATVTPLYTAGTAKPAGSVVFSNTSTSPATTLCTKTLSNGIVPTCSYTFTSAGSNSVVATFTSSDSNFSGSASSADVQAVGAGATSVSLTSLPASSTVNQQVTFSAAVTSTAGGTAVPQGSVVYSDGLTGTTLCTVTLTAAGSVPPCATPLFVAGTHTITATFTSSDSNFKSGASNVLSQIVSPTGTTTTLVAAPSTSSVNQKVAFTATVTPAIAPFSNSTNPTGGVTFSYTLGAQTAVLCTAAVPVSTTAMVTTAVCNAPLPTKGTYSIMAAYAGDKNFLGGSSAAISQTVSAPTTTVTVTAQPPSAVVNQQVSFTAAIVPSFAGSTEPSGTVVFTDTLTATQLCSITVSAAGTVAPCTVAFATAATHTITAAYSGDSNFPAATSAVFSEPVQVAPTAVSVVSSLPISVATQTVTFTASVTPTPTGAAVPTGKMTFTSSDGTLNALCGAVPVSAAANGTAAANCVAQFPLNEPVTASGAVTIAASYSGDNNFAASSNTSFQQTVQNFAVAFSAPASGQVTLTQGYSNAKDPFNPTKITVAVTSSGAFSDSLDVTCAVISATTNGPVSDPACSLSASTLPGTTGSSLTYTLTASPAALVGAYSVALTAVDHTTTALSHSTLPLTLYVVGVTGPLSLAQGATGTESAIFDTATPASGKAPTTLSSFACGTIVNVATGSQVSSAGVSCTGPSASVPVTGTQTTVSITITPSGTTVVQLWRSSTIYAAAFLGIPLLALASWFGRGKSRRGNFFRFLGLILIMVGASFAAGCGGSFTRPTTTTTTTGLAVGSYLVQVVGTDQNGAKYFAVVPLTVN